MLIQELRSPIYSLTPDRADGTGDAHAAVGAALRAGVGMIQYRAGTLATGDMIREATALVRLCRTKRTPLVMRGRVDVALAVGADGVHLDSHDMPVACARRLMGPGAIIGACVRTPADARLAQRDGATYVAVGPLYSSATRPGALALGLEAVRDVRAATALPICASGGIGPENLSEVLRAGVELVAVMSAIHDQADPAAAARELVTLAAAIPGPTRPAP